MTIDLLVLQPTAICNINCRYCYLPNRTVAGLMSDETLECVFQKILRSDLVARELRVLWHAGEPLTAGQPFFTRAMSLCKRHNTRDIHVSQEIQTNGTLITDEWCRFFIENSVGLGISIDGPEFLHDAQRRAWSGRGTHRRIMRSIDLLQRYGIEVYGLCVLTRESLKYPDEILDFFLNYGFTRIAFNVEEAENANVFTSLASPDNYASISLQVQDEYREFLSRFFDRWWPYRNRLPVREFSSIIDILRTKQARPGYSPLPEEVHPTKIFTILKNGDISSNSPELAGAYSHDFSNFVIGNIHQINEFSEVLDDQTYRRMQRDIVTGVKNCASTCLYFDLCGGGAPSNKYFEHGTFAATETNMCRLHKKVLASVIIEKLRSLSLDMLASDSVATQN